MKFKMKPLIKEAIQWDGNEGTFEVIENLGTHKDCARPYKGEQEELCIPTLEGLMIANLGDYIIKGVKGEIYPCKPDIFEMTYEPV